MSILPKETIKVTAQSDVCMNDVHEVAHERGHGRWTCA